MRDLIISSDPTILGWKSLEAKKAFILKVLRSGKNSKWKDVTVLYKDVLPLVVKERIDHDWLYKNNQPYFNQGYDMIAFHSSLKQWRDWGIKSSLRGSNPNGKREQEDMYFSADEKSKRNGLNRFEQVALHETSHGYYDHANENDLTHYYHANNVDISGLFKTFDWSRYQPVRMALKAEKNRLESIVAALVALLAKKTPTGTKPQVKPNFEPPKDLLPLVKRQADKFVQEMEMLGLPIRVTEGYRSPERQNELYAQGRTTKGPIVTIAKAGQSQHQYGNAIDIVFRKLGYDATNDQWLAAATVGERLGFDWGGDWVNFVDRPHFEMMKGYKLSDFQKGLVDYKKFN